MIRRPNVRSRFYRLNLYLSQDNIKESGRGRFAHARRLCRWCKRPESFYQVPKWPCLCSDCGMYLTQMETDHRITWGDGPFNQPYEVTRPPRRTIVVD